MNGAFSDDVLRFRFAELGFIQLLVGATGMNQVLVRPPLHNFSVPDHQDFIRRQNCGQPVGNQDGGALLNQRIDGRLDRGLRN